MSHAAVVGSGPSGVHLAMTLLELGWNVTLLDVGNERPAPPLPLADFDQLKERLEDPAAYFLGDDGRGAVLPSPRARYFAIPPSKDYVFAAPQGYSAVAEQIEPLIAFSGGGLAEAWTGGSYALNDAELGEFPFDAAALEPHYRTVVRRIGISAANDDLSRFSGWLDEYQSPVPPDANSASLLRRYAGRKTGLNARLGFFLGRSRAAVRTTPDENREACAELGRCLWGCPRNAIYAPSSTLGRLLDHDRFEYRRGLYVTHFEYDGEAVSSLVARDAAGETFSFRADLYALAAGALNSSKIVLESIYRRSGQVHTLPGLLDNAQFLMPFLNLSRLGRPVDTHTYQFHQLALGLTADSPEEYVHGQITALKSAMVHPVIQSLPVDLKTAHRIFRIAHAALGAANVWLHDRRSEANTLSIAPRPGQDSELLLRCQPHDPARFDAPVRKVKKALRRLGCFVPPGMTQILPKGSSVHYAGTIPIGTGAFTCDADCRSNDFSNLYFADGASFPFLPAKNLTFTLMANAVRVAAAMNRKHRGPI